jgi:hypothetical protein
MYTLIMMLTMLFALTGSSAAQMPTEPPHRGKEIVVEPVPGDSGAENQEKLVLPKRVPGKKTEERLMPVEPPAGPFPTETVVKPVSAASVTHKQIGKPKKNKLAGVQAVKKHDEIMMPVQPPAYQVQTDEPVAK